MQLPDGPARRGDGDGQWLVVDVSRDELIALSAAITETLGAIEDWELPIRTGFDRAGLGQLRGDVLRVLSAQRDR